MVYIKVTCYLTTHIKTGEREREREREKENISISVQNLVFVSDPLLPVHQYNLTREAEYQCLV
jgi:hypothetical protein